MNVNRELLAFLRKQYPVGTRIRLDSMQDPYAPMEAGTTGKLDYVDDAGQFHMKWDNGRTLALIPGVDSFTVLPPELSMTKLYMPLTAELYEPDVYGNMQEEPELLTGHDLTAYEDHIRSALVKYRMPEEVNRGIMHWYDTPDSVNDKVRSVTFDVERRNGKLWGIAECQVSGELSVAELTTLKKYIEGQASDGWGEGFEQHEIAVGRGSELYVHLWQDHGWNVQTEQERFRAHFEKLPEMCFSLLPGTGQLICIKRGESGYYPSDWSTGDAHENRRIADEQNRKRGVTPAQEEAMKIGSMCGWDVPGADPDNCEDIVQRRGGDGAWIKRLSPYTWAIPTTAITRSWSCPPRHGKWWMPWTDCVCQRDRNPIGRWRTWADMNFSPHILMGTICTSSTHWQRSSVHSAMWMPWLSRVWCRWSLTICIRTTAVI